MEKKKIPHCTDQDLSISTKQQKKILQLIRGKMDGIHLAAGRERRDFEGGEGYFSNNDRLELFFAFRCYDNKLIIKVDN